MELSEGGIDGHKDRERDCYRASGAVAVTLDFTLS